MLFRLLIVIVMVIHVVLVLTRVMIPVKVVLMVLSDAFEMRLELAMTLLPRKRADLHVDVSPGHLGLLITLAHSLQVFLDLARELVAKLLVRHLAASKLKLDAHLVTFGEEILRVGYLDEVVMRIDADAELHLLNFAAFLMLMSLLLVLLLDVFEFAVVDDLAYRRISLRSHFHQIQATLTSNTQRLMRRQNAKLMLAIFLNNTNFRRTNAFVNTIEFVGMTSAVTITATRASRPVSTAWRSTTKWTRRSTALSAGAILWRS